MARQESWGCGKEDQDREGGVLCRAGVLQLFYHVGALSLLLPLTMQPDLETDGNRLLFMTYNGWVMLAVAVGAFVGYLGFGNSSSTKSVACH